MKKLSHDNGKVICLVRPKDKAAAHARLAKEFEGLDKEFEREFHRLATTI